MASKQPRPKSPEEPVSESKECRVEPTAKGLEQSWAPPDVFKEMLRYSVLPTFDLILEFPSGIFLGRRKLAPYRGTWALPGLRMLKGESIDDVLVRVARSEVGVSVDPSLKQWVGQASPKFRSEYQRQDLASCYSFKVTDQLPMPNVDHFSGWRFVESIDGLPSSVGALYEGFLSTYFSER